MPGSARRRAVRDHVASSRCDVLTSRFRSVVRFVRSRRSYGRARDGPCPIELPRRAASASRTGTGQVGPPRRCPLGHGLVPESPPPRALSGGTSAAIVLGEQIPVPEEASMPQYLSPGVYVEEKE